MLAQILAFLSYYPNFLRQVAPLWWALFAGFCLWQAAISWSVYRQTGMRSYVGATVGSLLTMTGGVLAPLAQNLLQLVLMPAPLLLAGFVVLSLSDARSWFSSEAHDKYYLIRKGGLRLRLLGLVPRGFVHRESAPASWLQGVLIGGVTLLLLGLVYDGIWSANQRGALSDAALGWITLVSGLVAFHCVALIVCGILFGGVLRHLESDG
jgi:hypothetical protein